MCNVFIIQYSSVFMEFDKINGKRWHFGNHDAPQRVCQGGIRVAQRKFDFMRRNRRYFYFWETLVRHGSMG